MILFNVHNFSANYFEWELPVDILSHSNPVICNRQIYIVGNFMKQLGLEQMLNLDGEAVLAIGKQGAVI